MKDKSQELQARAATPSPEAASALGDSYCSLAWGGKLAKLAGDETAGGVIAGDVPGELSVREAALCDWCRAVVGDPMTTTNCPTASSTADY